jgi:hypothetical protein
MGKPLRGESFSRSVPLALTVLITFLVIATPAIQVASQSALAAVSAPCGGDARVDTPSTFPFNCSGSPGSLQILNTLQSSLVFQMLATDGVVLGSISATSSAPIATNLLNAVDKNKVIGPYDEQAVAYGSQAGSFTAVAAPEKQQELWATLSLVGTYLPVNMVGHASALKSAAQAWTSADTDYFSCLGAQPSAKKTASCNSQLVAGVGAIDAKLASSTGVEMAGSLKKSISTALAQVNIAVSTKDEVHQFNTVPPAGRTATIAAGAVVLGAKSNVLILGNGDPSQDPGYTSFSFLDSSLGNIGLNVTTLPGTAALPADLSNYGQIWWDGTQNLSTSDEHTLESFVRTGGSVYINGDFGVAAQFDNQSVLDIVQALVSKSISVSGISGTSPLSANSNVIDGVAVTPNALTTWSPNDEGTLTNVAPTNTLFPEGYGASGAVWDVGQSGGRLAVLMDANWAESAFCVTATATQVTENLGLFLSD